MRSFHPVSRRSTYTALLCAALGLALSGCFGWGDGFEDLGTGIACAFDFDIGDDSIDSDAGKVQAHVACEPNADCADVRTVIVGSRFDFVMEVPLYTITGQPSVSSTDESVARLHGFANDRDPCDGTAQLKGSVEFPAAGEVAIVVAVDGVELDRFSLSAQRAARVDIQAARGIAFFGGAYETVDTLSVDTVYALRALVRGEHGDRLAGATDFRWQMGATGIADFNGSGRAPDPLLFPRAIGTTTLSVVAHGATREIPLEVTAVPDYDDPDAGFGLPAPEDTDGGLMP